MVPWLQTRWCENFQQTQRDRSEASGDLVEPLAQELFKLQFCLGIVISIVSRSLSPWIEIAVFLMQCQCIFFLNKVIDITFIDFYGRFFQWHVWISVPQVPTGSPIYLVSFLSFNRWRCWFEFRRFNASTEIRVGHGSQVASGVEGVLLSVHWHVKVISKKTRFHHGMPFSAGK